MYTEVKALKAIYIYIIMLTASANFGLRAVWLTSYQVHKFEYKYLVMLVLVVSLLKIIVKFWFLKFFMFEV